jgi:Fe-S-cluster containining protein
MAEAPSERRMAAANITLGTSEWKLSATIQVSTDPMQVGDMLPLAWSLSDAIVARTQRSVEEQGHAVSCREGCASCCRMLVSTAEPEARYLARLVAAMPEPRQSDVRARFADAARKLDEAGLLDRLRQPGEWLEDEYSRIGEAYFGLQIACPFLDDERCRVYAHRPVACREHLVTSPSELCRTPGHEDTRKLRIPLPVFNAVARWQVEPGRHFKERWVPLIMALEFAAAQPDDPPARPGTELLSEFLTTLSGRGPDPPGANPPDGDVS